MIISAQPFQSLAHTSHSAHNPVDYIVRTSNYGYGMPIKCTPGLGIHSAMHAILFVSFNVVLGVVPNKSLLDHVSTITGDKTKEQGTSDPPLVLSIRSGLPPVPRKLITRIQAGEFVDMAELLPDRMGITTTPSKAPSHKHHRMGAMLQHLCSRPNIQVPRQDPRPHGLSRSHHQSLHEVWLQSVAGL